MGQVLTSVSEEEQFITTNNYNIHKGKVQVKLLLLGVSGSGKSTISYQLWKHFNKEEQVISPKETQKIQDSIKVWFSVIETAYNLIKMSNLIEMEKDTKEIVEFYEKTISGSSLGFERVEEGEYGGKKTLVDVSPTFSKILKSYSKYNPDVLIEQLRKNRSEYFDGIG